MPKPVNFLTLAILSISMLTIMAASAVSPALSAIKEAFPETSDTAIKMVMTLPSLVMIPFSLLSGWMTTHINKKGLVIVGMIVYLVFGIGGAFATTFTQLLICRACFGVSIGILMPLSNTLIFDLVEKDRQSSVMGLSVSSNQIGGILFLSIAGMLAGISWRYCFAVYLLVLLSLCLVAWKLPSMPPVRKADTLKTDAHPARVRLNWKIFAIAFLAMVSSACLFVVYTDLALYIQQEKPLFSSEVGLVSDRVTLQKQLAENQVGEELAANFAQQGITISPQASIKEIQPRQEWLIKSGMQEYHIRKTDNALQVTRSLGTAEMAGYALSLMGIPAAIAGFILAFLLKRMGYYLLPLAALLMAGGYMLLGYADSYLLILCSVLFIGLSGGLLSSPLMLLVPKVLSSQARSLGIAIVSSFILLGQFVSPFYTNGISWLTGYGDFRSKFLTVTVTLLVFAIGGCVYIFSNQRPLRHTFLA